MSKPEQAFVLRRATQDTIRRVHELCAIAAGVEARPRLTQIKATPLVLSTMLEPFVALGAYCRAMSRRLIYLLIAVFALLQGFQPLLHAHVGAAAQGHARIHLHALPNSTATAATGTASMSSATAPDTPAITPAKEYRRQERSLQASPTPAAAVRHVVAVLGYAEVMSARAPATAPVAGPRNILPPSLAPPRIS